MRILIVNADDFGLNDAATDGILQSHAAGSVTSTTMMVNTPGAQRAAKLAMAHSGLGIGLHFNLTWGRPISPQACVPTLVDSDGVFLSRGALARKLLFGRVPRSEVVVELNAQLARLRELGIEPTHIDSHQHVHGFGVVFDVVADVCAKAGLPMRVPWVASNGDSGLARKLRRTLLAAMVSRSASRWNQRVRWNDGLGSIFDLGLSQPVLDDDHYQRIIGGATGESFELMVHPVTNAAAMDGYTRIGAMGEAEWCYLRKGTLVGVARKAGFVLGTYRDINQ